MTIFIAKGAWHDKRGVRHNFEIESDRAERRFIIELVEAQYPATKVIVNSVRKTPSPHITNFQGYQGQPY
jgi:hypothetical protein